MPIERFLVFNASNSPEFFVSKERAAEFAKKIVEQHGGYRGIYYIVGEAIAKADITFD